FFQAEDGIRDLIVTGVQTCALPISNQILFISRQPVGVALISRGLAAVIVGAPDFALRDLRRQADQILPPDEPRNLPRLRCGVNVIEVENNGIGLTTVNTAMSQEVVVCEQLA